MEWPKPAVEMMQTWADSQRRIWSTWLDTTQGIGRAPTPDLRGKIIDTWQQSVEQMLDAQTQWLQVWVDSVKNTEHAPEPVRTWFAQSETVLHQWNGAQRQLWQGLFDLMRNAAPGASAQALERQGMEIFHAWQESVGNALGVHLNHPGAPRKSTRKK